MPGAEEEEEEKEEEPVERKSSSSSLVITQMKSISSRSEARLRQFGHVHRGDSAPGRRVMSLLLSAFGRSFFSLQTLSFAFFFFPRI